MCHVLERSGMSSLASVTLTQILAEMDQALADEIKKQSNYKQIKHIATNGKSLSEENGHYIYQYSLSEPWEPQDDIPLVIVNNPGRGIKCTVVNSVGTSITIATDQPLSPDLLRKIELSDDSTELLKRQREALKHADEGIAQLASKTFNLLPYQQRIENATITFGSHRPRDNQRIAAQMSLGGEVTFIVGPPGTGKTLTLAAIAFSHLQAGRTILIAAHTNIAIDNAIMKLCELCKKTHRQDLLTQGQVVRYGAVQKEELKYDQHYAEVYLPAIAKRLGVELHQQRDQTKLALDQVLLKLGEFQQRQQAVDKDKQHQLTDLNAQLIRHRQEMASLKQEELSRTSALQLQHAQYLEQATQINRDISTLHSHLAWGKALAEEKKQALEQEQRQEQQLLAQLIKGRAMGRMKRFFKGLNLHALETQVAQHSQAAYEIHQTVNALLPELERIHQNLALKGQEQKTCQQYLDDLSSQMAQPSENTEKIEKLKEQIVHIQQHLLELKTSLEREKRQSQQDQQQLKAQRAKLEEQLGKLDQQLRDIEKSIVEKACIVGTTLTKTYMNQTISGRRFDAVILDEISMAPLPSLYIATAHADRSVTLIGDPQQLAPIVSAETHLAKKWLGKDLFYHRGISLLTAMSGSQHSVMLNVQSRMHPGIAAIANTIVYEGNLLDDFDESRTQKITPLPDASLVLCNTHDASPIALRPKNGRSRLNYYHALCCLAIARKALASLPDLDKQTEPRIGIIAPYRPQAQLIQKMVANAGLQQQVQAGTVHRFQGLEFDIVIFDTVESPGLEPGEFISGSFGSDSMRLINVAVTRARQKLFLVANLQHIQQKLPAGSILRESVKIASQSALLSSLDVVGTSFASVAEQAYKLQNQVAGQFNDQQHFDTTSIVNSLLPSLEEDILVLKPTQRVEQEEHDRASSDASSLTEQRAIEHYTEKTFYEVFKRDFLQACTSIVIFSPYTSENRLENGLLPLLMEQQKKKIPITIVTRPLEEKKDKWDYKGAKKLRDKGFKLTDRPRMHEKVVIIDDAILYHGSLNVLSHNDTKESVLRITVKYVIDLIKESLLANNSSRSDKKLN